MTERPPRGVPSWKLLAVLAAPILGALAFSQLTFMGQTAPENQRWSLTGFEPFALLILASSVVPLSLYGIKRFGQRAARLVVSIMILTGTFSALVLLRFILDPFAGVSVVVYLLAPPIGYFGLYWSLRYYWGTLSEKRTVWATTGSTILTGALIGVVLPLPFTLALLVALSLLDVALVEKDIVRKAAPEKEYASLLSAMTVQLEEVSIGMGDILAYSVLASGSIYNFGIYLALATAGLIFAGEILTVKIARSRFKVAGLPLPIWFGAVPVVTMMIVS